jgi:hypothetical protein
MKKNNLFQRQRSQLEKSGIASDSATSLLCPLCWKEATFDEMSVEHVIPYEVGGRREVLTCKPCYMKDVAAAKGIRGAPCEANIEGNRLAVDISFGAGVQLRVADKATNPAAVAAVKEVFRKQSFESLDLKVRSQFSPAKLRLAVLKAAYLSLFHCFDYRVLALDGMQELRKRVTDQTITAPPIEPLVVWLNGFDPACKSQYFIFDICLNDIQATYVILRLKFGSLQKYVAAFMPTFSGDTTQFHANMKEYVDKQPSAQLSLPKLCWTDEQD